ncbi:hypothetical protein DMB66_15590 [Actinoplanes sp. ATCC 53533]|nr:hypothetical protein DMB66_15590 [Actinoplanes sp. ATCC 53533]
MFGLTRSGAISAATASTVVAAFACSGLAASALTVVAGLAGSGLAGAASTAGSGLVGAASTVAAALAGSGLVGAALAEAVAFRGVRFAGAVLACGVAFVGGAAVGCACAGGWGALAAGGGVDFAGDRGADLRGVDFAGPRCWRVDGVACGASVPVPEAVLSSAGGRKVTGGGAFAGFFWGVGCSGVLNAGFDVRGRRCFGSFSSMPREPSRAAAV